MMIWWMALVLIWTSVAGALEVFPAPVVTAGTHVLKLISLEATANAPDFRISRTDYSDMLRGFRLTGSDFEADQLQFCFMQRQKVCPVYGRKSLGSGFLLPDRETLVTSYHGIRQSLFSNFNPIASTLVDLRKIPLFVTAYSASNQLLFSAIRPGDEIRVKTLNPSAYFFAFPYFAGYLWGEISDLAILKVPVTKAVPLELADRDLSAGDAIYGVGYPKGHLHFEAGHVLSAEDLLKMMGNASEDPALTNLRRDFLIFSTMTCAAGSSGGPMMNAEGQVVGVVAGYYLFEKLHARVCYGVNLLHFSALKAYWQKVNEQSVAPDKSLVSRF